MTKFEPTGYPHPNKIRSMMGGFAMQTHPPDERAAILAELRQRHQLSKEYHRVFGVLMALPIADRQQFLAKLRIDVQEATHATAR